LRGPSSLALRLATLILALPLLYLLAGFAGALLPGAHSPAAGAPTERIGLLRGAIHYDFLLPLTPSLRETFGFAAQGGLPVQDPRAEWLIVGWGAEAFYTTTGSYRDLNTGAVWKAVTGDDAVLRLDLAGKIDMANTIPGLHWLDLPPAALDRLARAIAADASPSPEVLPGLSLGGSDIFYRARDRFNLGRTCNVWLGEMIRAAGLPFGRWTPTPQAVDLALWWNAADG
jgi:uncharacterized protein (TIGR02117 family)